MRNIKRSIGKLSLKKNLRKNRRQLRVHNFNTAQTVGILFNSPDEESFRIVKDFLSFLSNNNLKVIALGYVPEKKIPENLLLRKGINFFCKKDLTWYYKPKNESVNQFILQDFDLLIDLSLKEYFPLYYIGQLSNASFKIGRQPEKYQYQDLMIDIGKNHSIDYLIEQIKHYLTIINQ
ncbi:MAG: hypothetical protein V2I54_00525 [Bacteroidales bacterium]|jgi:hypothetical protein|nr:hypothetical protein [Bacteroidales bacterium]